MSHSAFHDDEEEVQEEEEGGTLKNLNMLSPPEPNTEQDVSTSNYNLGQLAEQQEDSYD